MKIRSITYFFNPGWPLDENKFQLAGRFLADAKSAFEAARYEVQTMRLATVPFPHLLDNHIEETPKLAEAIEGLMPSIGVEYAALGPAFPNMPGSYEIIPEAISHTQNVFFSGVMADKQNGISLEAVRACAGVIVKCAPLTPNGFANLRFAALANVLPGAPFFPAAYHRGDAPAFSIAAEAADLAVEAFSGQRTLDDGRQTLIAEITKHGKAIARVAQELTRFPFPASQSPLFGGIDFSLAPFPIDEKSLGGAVEGMGVPMIGLHGSLAAAAILTEAVDRADFPHTGFSGFMQPVLEDSVLAKRAAEGTLTIKDLLLYSAVCGTGLDTVPLPGDVSADQIAALLLDLSALALRLDKPLTARLMPIPGKRAGDPTKFDFAYFANSKVMTLEAGTLGRVLSGNEVFQLQRLKQGNL
ncbi:MAG: DUF711 family protein [Anaerolineales bacterium]|nr:DUF711 family protein [Anaerolineales bacterium]